MKVSDRLNIKLPFKVPSKGYRYCSP